MRPDDSWLALLHAAERNPRPLRDALDRAGSAAALLSKPARRLAALGLDDATIAALLAPDCDVLDRWRDWLARPAHALVTRDSAEYPQRLAEITDAPLALWVRGARQDLLAGPQIAIVGSRKPTANGRATARTFAAEIAAFGLTVTSGLAVGIDAAAHRGGLAGVGGTLAVLGAGIDVDYPRVNAALAAEIAAAGVIVSEYPPGTPPRPHRFPERNRIIAGLTLGTLVVEATRKSGSLITARVARDHGREVFAMPGSIHSPLARGCHFLLRQGATLVESAADVLVEIAAQIALPPRAVPRVVPDDAPTSRQRALDLRDTGTLAARAPDASVLDADTLAAQAPGAHARDLVDPAHAKLLAALGYAPATIEELMPAAGLTTAELSSMLLVLELQGQVEALPGGRYCRLAKRSE